MSRAFLLSFLLLTSCSTVGQDKPHGPLAKRVGHQVELKGSYTIGKLANAVSSKDWYVYLFDPLQVPTKINPGTQIIASGRLEFVKGVRGSDCSVHDCAVPGIPPHYFMRGASVVVAP